MAKFFIPLRKLLKSILLLDVDAIALQITKTAALKKLVISLNTEGTPTSQLFIKGEDSLGNKLKGQTIVTDGEYSPLTKSIKQAKGQPTDRVTLKDTGEFYLSFDVIPYKGGFEIVADPFKTAFDGTTNLLDEFGSEILGLNQENLQIVINFYRDAIQQKVNQKLRAA